VIAAAPNAIGRPIEAGQRIAKRTEAAEQTTASTADQTTLLRA